MDVINFVWLLLFFRFIMRKIHRKFRIHFTTSTKKKDKLSLTLNSMLNRQKFRWLLRFQKKTRTNTFKLFHTQWERLVKCEYIYISILSVCVSVYVFLLLLLSPVEQTPILFCSSCVFEKDDLIWFDLMSSHQWLRFSLSFALHCTYKWDNFNQLSWMNTCCIWQDNFFILKSSKQKQRKREKYELHQFTQ